MSDIKYYNLSTEGNKFLTPHFQVHEFADPSDYVNVSYPEDIPIHDKLPLTLEKVFEHFGCTKGIINSGYRSPDADIDVGGSGSGPHTLGIAADVYFYKGSEPVPSRLVACFLQDEGIKGIGLNCGGNPNGTHIDMRGFGVWNDSVWYGDEAVRNGGIYKTVSDFYSYTGTTKDEVYPDGDNDEPANDNVRNDYTTSTRMVDIIKTYEGFSPRAIKLAGEDEYTIGYGHYGSDVHAGDTITEAEATELLERDLKVFESAVKNAVKVDITQSQFDALVSLSYNIGTGAFANSDTVKALNEGKVGHAAVDIPSWRRGMGYQILPGLEKRRQTELEFFAAGEDFTITDCMNVRAGAGTNYPVKTISQITVNGRENAVDKSASAQAVFREGTEITALEVKAVYSPQRVEVWFRCPSGWICARMGDEVFVN